MDCYYPFRDASLMQESRTAMYCHLTTAGSAKPCGGLFSGTGATAPIVLGSGLGASRATAGGNL